MKEVIELLKQSELFASLPVEKIEQIISIGRVKTFDAGETIIAEGEPSDEMYVVQEGMVEVLVASGALHDIPGPPELTPVVQLGRGQVFGEMALVDRGARSATVRCVEDGTTLFVIPRQAFWELCDADHHIGYIVMRNIARDLSFKLRHRNLPRALGA
ncbi:MAG TPA: cyclic nucleotide-binding domain-containing protein [Anaerolineales bacterium]|nr:cyclic nucleotide-binding domain-containing protein [Anaerolineae bacterium]HIQ01165.1 cyclic nucleotide-binding domain-containing protein [Anaerolineales bacterium]